MSTVLRFGYGLSATISLAVGGIVYQQVFVEEILPMVDLSGKFSTPVVWLDRLVPVIFIGLLLAVWVWVIAGAVRSERTVDRRRRRIR